MSEENATSAVAEMKAEPSAAVLELKEEIGDLRRTVAELSIPGAVTEPEISWDEYQTAKMLTFAWDKGLDLKDADARDRAAKIVKAVEEYALAKDNTTVGAGVVPNWKSQDVISIIDTDRPINNQFRKYPLGDYGMTIDYPIVATKPTIAVQSAQHDQPSSTQIDINTSQLSIGTYAGANDIAVQLLERSWPGYLQVIYDEWAHQYAVKTEAVLAAALLAGAGNSAVVADLSADAAATQAAIATAFGVVFAAVNRAPDLLVVGTTRYTQLLSLADSTDRPLVVFGPAVNAAGTAGPGVSFSFMGMNGIVSANTANATDCLLIATGRSARIAEAPPTRVSVNSVSTLSVHAGLYGYYGVLAAYTGGIYSIPAST